MPPIFSSNRIVPTGRSMPKFVPIPISPEPRRAGVGGERLAQVGLAAVGARLDHPPGAELELDPLDRHPARARGDREADVALRGVLDRAREDLARGHVAPAVGVHPRAPRDAQAQVGPLGLDAQLARAREALDQPRLARAQLAPGRDRVVAVEEQRALDQRGEVARSPSAPAARPPRSATASRTSAAASPARAPAPACAPRAPAAPGRRPPARSCSRAPGSSAGSRRSRVSACSPGESESRWTSRAAAQ